MYKTNSFERYQQGKTLVEQYNTKTNVAMILIFVFGMAGLAVHAKYDVNIVLAVIWMFVPAFFGIKWSLKVTNGALLKKSAEETFGHNDEEYEGRI